MIKLYKTYNKVKNVFVKPKLHFKFGLWENDRNLPIWRRGPIIHLCKQKDIGYINPIQCESNDAKRAAKSYKVYPVVSRINVKVGTKTYTRNDGTTYNINSYISSEHKLPKGYQNRDYVWRRDIRKKLRKLHLGWIKPQIQLPRFFAFHIFNYDLGWKTKWGDYRYEWPPQFTIVLFGLSFSWWLTAPTDRDYDYWESVLNYIEYKDLYKTNKVMGQYTKNMEPTLYYRFLPEFLKEPYCTQLKAIHKEV